MGLREQKKQQLRAELSAAALELFISRGYEATTVDDIAAAVNVSPRTFFRYFASKEDCAIEPLHVGILDLREHLARRPRTEPLPEALRAAVRQWLGSQERAPATMLQVNMLLKANAALRARMEDERRAPELVNIVAGRLGVDPTLDHRPRIIVSLLFSAVGCAIDRWSDDGGAGDLQTYIDSGLEMLRCGLPTGARDTPEDLSTQPAERAQVHD